LISIAAFLVGSPIIHAIVPDVGPAVCAWTKANGERCDESIEYCAEGCPLKISGDVSTPNSGTQSSPSAGTNKTLIWATAAGFVGFLGVFLLVAILSGNLVAMALVASGIALLSLNVYSIVKGTLPSTNKENVTTSTTVAGDWKGRYTITAPPECKGEESGWEVSLEKGDPQDLTWNTGGVTFHGKASGNTVQGFFAGPPCGFSPDNEPVSGTFFGGRIVPTE
jgi:hypothetical protein